MPLGKHFGGHGEAVMADMKKRYGAKAERIFYATENKRKKESPFAAGMRHGKASKKK